MRCSWVKEEDLIMREYHDNEYGNMINDNNKMFELLSLEINQTGLSWKIVLDKRDAFNKVFFNFDIKQVATHDYDIDSLLENKDIIRNRMKLEAIINNAKVIYDSNINLVNLVLEVFDKYKENYKLAIKYYKSLGFKFIGPSVLESLYMALGLLEGHEESCFKYNQNLIK